MRPRSLRPSLLLAALLALAVPPARAQTEAPPRRRVDHEHAWLQLFAEQRLAPRWALHAETQIRRADLGGRSPQQLLARPGLLFDLAPGARGGAGYAWVWSSVYGEAPAVAPAPEHRIWEQLQLATATGPVAWAHRLRAEQRWLGQTVAAPGGGGTLTGWRFRQRARVMTRATVDAPSLGVPLPRLYATAHGELFVQLGATPDGQRFDQSRLALQGGWRATPHLRVEAGYMQQLIQRGGARVVENNHTVLLTVVRTGG